MLSNTNDKKLTNIISTIQKEQNQIIRNEDDKNLLVQGTAGSGKTVVALHRIAYLLYRDAKLESKNILIISEFCVSALSVAFRFKKELYFSLKD